MAGETGPAPEAGGRPSSRRVPDPAGRLNSRSWDTEHHVCASAPWINRADERRFDSPCST